MFGARLEEDGPYWGKDIAEAIRKARADKQQRDDRFRAEAAGSIRKNGLYDGRTEISAKIGRSSTEVASEIEEFALGRILTEKERRSIEKFRLTIEKSKSAK